MFYRIGSNAVIEDILEAKQALHVLAFSNSSYKYSEIVCNTREYNKIKKTSGFKELDHYQIPPNDSPDRFYLFINEKIRRYGLNKLSNSNGIVLGKEKQPGYGFGIFPDSDLKIESFGFSKAYGGAGTNESLSPNKVTFDEYDVDKQFDIYKKSGTYPKEPIVKYKWSVTQIDTDHVLLSRDDASKKIKIIDDGSVSDYKGKPMKSGIKFVGGADGFFKFVFGSIINGQAGMNVQNLVNTAWEICNSVK